MMVTMPFIEVRHNIEVAHRLYLTEGKCQQIHGHSMWVELALYGNHFSSEGILLNYYDDPLEFGSTKKTLRDYLDNMYDHKLLLNKEDPWAQPLTTGYNKDTNTEWGNLPGLQACGGDPTTENIAKWIADWAAMKYKADANVTVRETAVNAAAAGAYFKV
jgi:6-pyruvoyl-tetrahydropterin synthase